MLQLLQVKQDSCRSEINSPFLVPWALMLLPFLSKLQISTSVPCRRPFNALILTIWGLNAFKYYSTASETELPRLKSDKKITSPSLVKTN